MVNQTAIRGVHPVLLLAHGIHNTIDPPGCLDSAKPDNRPPIKISIFNVAHLMILIPKKFACTFSFKFAHHVHTFLILSPVFIVQFLATMKQGEIFVVTLDYDKNIYLTPNRGTVNLTNLLNSSAKHTVDEELHQTLSEMRDNQWNRKKAATGYKNKRVRWHLLLDAFMKDYSDTHSLTEGARMAALLKKAKN